MFRTLILNTLRASKYNHVDRVHNALNMDINKVCVNLVQINVYTKKTIYENITEFFCRSMKIVYTFSDKIINILLLFRTNPSNHYHFDSKY